MIIKDKQFKSYISEQQIKAAVKNMSGLINAELKNELPIFLVVLNGAFMFASDLLKQIRIPCEICFIKLTSYQGVVSTQTVSEVLGLNQDLTGRTVVIVEDIIDTGLTVAYLINSLNQKKVKKIKIATAFMKPDCYQQVYTIDYVGISIKNNFVVGYGLDYNGQGRNLKKTIRFSIKK
jgi:hypoxanthine phosphoribosyltransferase